MLPLDGTRQIKTVAPQRFLRSINADQQVTKRLQLVINSADYSGSYIQLATKLTERLSESS